MNSSLAASRTFRWVAVLSLGTNLLPVLDFTNFMLTQLANGVKFGYNQRLRPHHLYTASLLLIFFPMIANNLPRIEYFFISSL